VGSLRTVSLMVVPLIVLLLPGTKLFGRGSEDAPEGTRFTPEAGLKSTSGWPMQPL
jgi:hypothetical protein